MSKHSRYLDRHNVQNGQGGRFTRKKLGATVVKGAAAGAAIIAPLAAFSVAAPTILAVGAVAGATGGVLGFAQRRAKAVKRERKLRRVEEEGEAFGRGFLAKGKRPKRDAAKTREFLTETVAANRRRKRKAPMPR